MLRTGKQVWEASAKRRAIELRHEELQFHIERYTTLITQASVLAGFAFESLVHLEPPEETPIQIQNAFYYSLTLSFLCSLYVVVCGSCLVVFGYQLALLGADGSSLEDAVTQLRQRRFVIFSLGFIALALLVVAGVALVWIKFPPAGTYLSYAFAVFTALTLWSVSSIFCAIGNRKLVTGAAKFITPECAHLGARARSPCRPAAPQRLIRAQRPPRASQWLLRPGDIATKCGQSQGACVRVSRWGCHDDVG